MKIITPGDISMLRRTKRFRCPYCGCIFEADEGEYKHGPQWEPEAYCVCPTCGKNACEM